MRCKRGVKVFGVRPELTFAIQVAAQVYEENNLGFILTSVSEPGGHSRGSLHYTGAACDIRTRHIAEDRVEIIRQAIADRLTDEYDVILEPGPSQHIHLEFQPKE